MAAEPAPYPHNGAAPHAEAAVSDLRRRLDGARPIPAGPVVRVDPARWPDPLSPLALHGPAGAAVRAMAPTTEADPAALLTNILVMAGSAIGRGPYVEVGYARHGTNLYVLQVGRTAKARKGTAEAGPRRLFRDVDAAWEAARVLGGLSSGEGLIWAVRDAIEKTEPIKEKGQVVGYQQVTTDPGVADKRLLVIEEEFASTLKQGAREGNTLSPVMRQAWDGKDLRAMTKNSPAVATAPHVSVIGHITKDELHRNFDSTEAANGFFNRFLLVCVKRGNVLPEGGRLANEAMRDLVRRLTAAVDFARRAGRVERDDAARALWAEVYRDLSEGKPGMFGAVTARAEAQVLRLSLLYALLDSSRLIRAPHLTAALALWDYCEASARFVFGDNTGDPTADRILRELRAKGELSQTEVVNLFGRHTRAAEIDRGLEVLVDARLAASVRDADTGGRPATRWVPL